MRYEWEGCMATGEACTYNPYDPTDTSFFQPPAVCNQGDLPSFYVSY